MKNMKKLILTVIFIILAFLICFPNKTYARTLSIGDTIQLSENDMRNGDDIYCVAHGKHFGSLKGIDYKYDFKVVGYVKLVGQNATGVSVDGQNVVIDNSLNATVAAILGGDLQRGYGTPNNYNEAQKALYKIWNAWVGAVGGKYGFQPCSDNDNVDGQAFLNQAQSAAAQKDYEATIYLLKPQGEATALNIQELIAVDAPEPTTPNEPGRTVVKAQVNISGFVWEDIENSKNNTTNNIYEQGELRLEGIKVYWKGPVGEVIASTTTGADGSYALSTEFDLWNHPYGIKDQERYDMINNSHIEFEYNGLKYTTVAVNGDLSDTVSSKAREVESSRETVDNKFNRVEDEAVYDANNNVIINNLPNTTITDANYSSEFSVTASTGSVVGNLLDKSKANGWTATRTFCADHCTVGEKHIAAQYTRVVKVREATYTISRKNPTTGKNETKPDIKESEIQGYIDDGWSSTVQDDGNENVTVTIYCTGDVVISPLQYESALKQQYPNDIYRELMGTEYNNYGLLHYYDAGEVSIGGYPAPTSKDCRSSVDGIWQWNIYNVNLGLVKREQPYARLLTDIEKVRVIMKNQEYTYIYGNRGISDTDAAFDYKVKWGNKYNTQKYTRPVNPADIAYVNQNNSDDLKVYVTYNIVVNNDSATLPMTINKIVNYYDSNYTIYTGQGTATQAGWIESTNTSNGYKIAYSTALAGKVLAPGQSSEIIRIEFEISQEAIKGLLNNDATLYNVSEIFSYSTWYGENTLCAERETATLKNKVGKQYAGLDKKSTPGNAVPGDLNTYEDDTDRAPSFLLMKDPNYKTMTGTVWEDSQTESSKTNNERLGDGVQNGSEKGVQNVKVELLNAETGEVANIYSTSGGTATSKPAVTYTDENGNYSFGDGNDWGVVVDNYIIKYTYGNDTTELTEGATSINGNTINARNYKSTVITDSLIKDVMQGSNTTDKWHVEMDASKNTSIAVDDIKERLEIPSLKYDNFDTPINISAYSRPVKIQIEYTEEQQENMTYSNDNEIDVDGKVYSENGENKTFQTSLDVFDFGIIERAREDLVIEKTIGKIKVTLGNGQVLIDGNPTIEDLNYVKALGIKNQKINTRAQSNSALDKFLTIELDSELIQGATLEIWYEITVTNNSEMDYEYYADYTDIDQVTKFITTNGQAKYYYYGDGNRSELTPIMSTVELVADYMDPELVCRVGDEAQPIIGDKAIDNSVWHIYDSSATNFITPDNSGEIITADRLKENGYISTKIDETDIDKTYETLKNEKYQIFVTDTFKGLRAGGETKTSTLYASKLLANSEEEHSYENHVEILQINGRMARTIDSVKDDTREQVVKTYKSGNYIPSFASRTTNADGTLEIAGLHQPDDDRVRIVVTPPTGISEYIVTYIIAGVVGLIVVVAGIVFIKKKVINK